MSVIKDLFCGAVIGIANIIPGVSGGTMMVVLGVYDKLISSISNIKSKFVSSAKYLFIIVLGALLAILLTSKGITFMLDNYYMITNFFFIGVIVGSIPMVWNKATIDSFKASHLIPMFVTLAIMIATVFLSPPTNESVATSLTFTNFFTLMFSGALAGFCMIIPGISGSFVMLLIGVYETITTALSDLNILMLIPIAIGSLLGVLIGAKIIEKMLKKFPQATYFAILGFVFGSIPSVFERIVSSGNLVIDIRLVYSIIALIFGGVLSYVFSSEKIKDKFLTKINKNEEIMK